LPATATSSPQVKPHYGVQSLAPRILRNLQKAGPRRKCRWQYRQTSESSSSSSSIENVVPFFQENLASQDRQVQFD
jgi:hypothetical protein